MPKILKCDIGGGREQFLYMCKGCGYEHAFEKSIHQFNDNYENPTISPSLFENRNPARICHSFIVNGQIQYLNDCWHEYAGKTIELPDVMEWKALKAELFKIKNAA